MCVFLSYDLRDAEAATALRARLAREGLTVRDGGADPTWALPVEERLRGTDALVVLISANSSDSVSVSRDLDYVLTTKRFKDRLIPVLLDGTRDYPWILDEMSPVSAAASLDEVAETVAQRLGRVPAA
ncbi:MAG: TIR domain-containing protein [Dehalococcoidia bacterium]